MTSYKRNFPLLMRGTHTNIQSSHPPPSLHPSFPSINLQILLGVSKSPNSPLTSSLFRAEEGRRGEREGLGEDFTPWHCMHKVHSRRNSRLWMRTVLEHQWCLGEYRGTAMWLKWHSSEALKVALTQLWRGASSENFSRNFDQLWSLGEDDVNSRLECGQTNRVSV